MIDLLNTIEELIAEGNRIINEDYEPIVPGICVSPTVSGEAYELWMNKIDILNKRYLNDHPLHNSIYTNNFQKTHKISDCKAMIGYLKAIQQDKEFWGGIDIEGSKLMQKEPNKHRIRMSTEVFIVHGHDEAAKEKVARTIEQIGYEAIILHEQPNLGKTIMEKIEHYTNVDFAIVLYTGCDLGRENSEPVENERLRARQNVVYEHGYLIGKLGREKVFALVKGEVETPGDISGVVYTPMDDAGAWRMIMVKEMQEIGLNVDANKLTKRV